jgi:type II secretion system protein C
MSAMHDLPDPPAPEAGPEFLDRLRQHAFSHHQRGEFAAAELAYQRILGKFPADFEVRHALGAVALQTGRYRWALQLLSQVASFQDSADLQAELGSAYCGLSRLDDALRCYERAIAGQFDHLSARVNRAQVLHAMGRFEEAAAAYRRTIALGLNNAAIHTLHGLSLSELGRTEESIACFHRALALDPGYLAAHVNLAAQLRKPGAAAALAGPAPPPAQVEELADAHEPAEVERPSAARLDSLRRLDWRVLLPGAAPTLASCLLSALVVSELVHAAMVLHAAKPSALAAAPLPIHAAPQGLDVAPIVAAHLFGQVKELKDPAAAAPSIANLKLTGTLATGDPRHGIAIIGDQATTHVYSIGESLDGASLWEVYQDHVILERNGAYETLSLPRGPSLKGSTASPSAGVRGELEAGALMDELADSRLQTDGAGSTLGIRVVPGKDRAKFMKSGLMGGDIVVAVNGAKLDSTSGDLWKHVSNGSSITVLRRGVTKEITLDVPE